VSLSQVLAEIYGFLKSMFRYREIAFWMIGFPVIFLLVLIAVFASAPGSFEIEVAVVDRDGGPYSEAVVEALGSARVIRVHILDASPEELVEAVANGSFTAALVIWEVFSERISAGSQATLTLLYYSGPEAGGVVSSVVESVIAGLERSILEGWAGGEGLLLDPISVEGVPVSPEALATRGGVRTFYVVGMIGVQILFSGMYTGASIIVERKRDGTLRVLLSSPIRGYTIFAADTVTSMVALLISATAILATGYLVGADYSLIAGYDALAVAGLLAAGLLGSIGLGLLLAPLARSQEAVNMLVNSIAFPLMFLGGIVIPSFILPEWAQAIPKLFPLYWCLEGARRVFLHDYDPLAAIETALPGIASSIALYLAGSLVYRRLLERSVEIL
jgi:ABC-2 type transport system permease protein